VISQPLTREDVEGVYAGLRPLLTGESESTSKLSREHTVAVPVPGLVAVAGGKYTTYRVMARDAIDAAAHGLDRQVPPSATHVTPLVGAEGFQAAWNRRGTTAAESGVHVARVEHLLRRYGTRTDELLEMIAEEPELGKPVPGADDYLSVEVRYAASHEGALHLDDVLTRRTRISIETWDRGLEAAEPSARLMAGPLGWDEQTIEREVSLYRERVAAERRSQEQPDDRAADLERLSAPDVFSPSR
jgi:glycerol-3-phosphate dehydrogenase